MHRVMTHIVDTISRLFTGFIILWSLFAGLTPAAAFPIRDIPHAAPGISGVAFQPASPVSFPVMSDLSASLVVTRLDIPALVGSSVLLDAPHDAGPPPMVSGPSDIGVFLSIMSREMFLPVGFAWDESRVSLEAVQNIPVPEPGTLTLMVLTGGGVLIIGRWKQRIAGHIRLVIAAVRLPVPDPQIQARDARLRLVGLMTGELLHDLRNVMTGVHTCALVLSEEGLTDDERVEFRQLLETELERGEMMTRDVLDFAAGRDPELHLEPTDLHDLLHEVIVTLDREWAEQPITVRSHLEDTSLVCLDAHKMKRVLQNLAVNARDAMPDGGTLTVSSSRCGDLVRIDIRDTGCGMSPQLQQRIFEPFVTEGKVNGTGLGLAITRKIITGHHGRIDVHSAVGQGTTVSLSLPVMTDASSAHHSP